MSSTAQITGPGARGVGIHFEGDLRRSLIDAAASLLDESGAEGLSLREVARRVGVSHAAPAHHFGDKAGLLTAVAIVGFELFVDHLGSALTGCEEPLAQLGSLGRAYAEFAELHPGHFEVMFRPGLTRTDDVDYVAASDAAFGSLRDHIEVCQRAGWHVGDDTQALAAASWALAHGLSVLRNQGSLRRHYPDASLDGVVTIADTLIGSADA